MATTQKATEAKATEATATEAKPADEVRYKGTADVRKITKAQWAKAGVEDQEAVTWDLSNRHTVKASDLNAAALEVLAKDSNFQLPKTD